jgi:spore germination cell wall hydrolase CwlJ-like protein
MHINKSSVIGGTLLFVWGTLVFASVLPAPSTNDITPSDITFNNIIPEVVPQPSQHPKITPIKSPPKTTDKEPVVSTLSFDAAQNIRPVPFITLDEKYVMAITLGQEARIDTPLGQHAVLAVLMNRLGTTKDRTTLKEVIMEENQFSFLWGDTLTQSGRILKQGNKKEIATLAKTKYAKELEFVLAFTQKSHYNDITNGRTYYYNPKASSEKGKKWFAENVTDCKKIGQHHKFCYGRH